MMAFVRVEEKFLKVPIVVLEEYGLSTKVIDTIYDAGFEQIEDLREATPLDILFIPNLAQQQIHYLATALKRYLSKYGTIIERTKNF